MKWYLLLLLLCAINVSAVHINEINYNPEGPDNNKEYVEIYLPDATNLDNWIIADAHSNDTLETISYTNSSYALIVEEGFNTSKLNCSFYSAGAAIGNSLNNKEDNVSLYNEILVDNANYSVETEKTLSLVNNSWQVKEKTPCKQNIPEEKTNTSNETTNNQTISNQTEDNQTTSNKTQNTIDKNYNPSFDITTNKDTYNYNEKVKFSHHTDAENFSITYWIQTLDGEIIKEKYTTQNLNEKQWTAKTKHSALLIKSVLNASCNKTKNSEKLIAVTHETESSAKEPNNSRDCNPAFNITTEKDLYNYDEKINFRHELKEKAEPFSITYWIQSLDGEILKEEYTTENLNEKSWTADTKHSAVLIKSTLEADCSPGEEFEAKKLVGVKQDNDYKNNLQILDINTGRDEKVDFGDVFTAEIKITKAETDKYSIKAYVKNDSNKISDTTKTHIRQKNSKTKLTIPLALEQNCNKEYKKGNYKLKLKGLGQETEESLYVNHNDCPIKTVEKEIEKQKPKISSFYTLMENYHKKINLYATFDQINSTHKLTLQSHFNQTNYTINNNSKITMKARAKRGNNLYILKLKHDKTIDTKSLKISLPKLEKETRNITFNLSSNKSSSKITGNIYKSAGIKSKQTSKYLIAGLSLIVAGYMFYSRETIRKLFKRPSFMLQNGSANSRKSNNRNARVSKRPY